MCSQARAHEMTHSRLAVSSLSPAAKGCLGSGALGRTWQDLRGFEPGAQRALPPPAHAPPGGVCACAGSARAGRSPAAPPRSRPPHGAPRKRVESQKVGIALLEPWEERSSPGPRCGLVQGLRDLCRT